MQSRSRPYPFDRIEPKWQQFWEEHQTFHSAQPGEPGSEKPKYYVLDMFPYPSGAGLHVGHLEGYTATDIIARYKRMRGFNVLHPMGWDAFGLPAEQHAIQVGTHPRTTVEKNVANFKRQIQSMGFSYDWSREVNTTDPGYYKWTQWIFLQLYQKGLAYTAEAPVWYCPALGTVLANEEVLLTPSGPRSERGHHPVERRPLRQWMLRITAYADRLLKDLDPLDWPESLKEMQRNWIGRSEGAMISFQVEGRKEAIEVYTTCPDTLWGATYLVIAPEHPLVKELTTDEQKAYVSAYLEQVALKSDLERTDLAKTKTGIFTGSYALHPASGRKLPIWVADYVLATYGTGAIMAVPAHDERDYDFATQFGLPILRVIRPIDSAKDAHRRSVDGQTEGCFTGEGISINSGPLDGLPTREAKEKAIQWLETKGAGRRSVQYKLRDWLFSRQRYWGEPFPILWKNGEHRPLDVSELPLELPELDNFQPSPQGEAPLAKAKRWLTLEDGSIRETNTMPQWAGSCWYYLRYCDPKNAEKLVDPAAERYWMGEHGIDLYVGGAEHAVLHLLYARFWHKALFDIGVVSTSEPFHKLVNQGLILGEDHQKMSKSLGNVVNPDELLENYGADAIRLFEMFMGPLEQTKPWSTQGLEGVYRFLGRAWRLIMIEETEGSGRWKLSPSVQNIEPQIDTLRALHRAIDKVTEDTEALRFNTAIAELMILVNELTPLAVRAKSILESFVLLLSPFAPHIAEELWSQLGHSDSLAYEPWPQADPNLLAEEEVEIVIQINGKIKERITVPTSLDASEYEKRTRAHASFHSWIADKKIEKVIVVPQKLVNFVVA